MTSHHVGWALSREKHQEAARAWSIIVFRVLLVLWVLLLCCFFTVGCSTRTYAQQTMENES
jgi:hypothetical protein